MAVDAPATVNEPQAEEVVCSYGRIIVVGSFR